MDFNVSLVFVRHDDREIRAGRGSRESVVFMGTVDPWRRSWRRAPMCLGDRGQTPTSLTRSGRSCPVRRRSRMRGGMPVLGGGPVVPMRGLLAGSFQSGPAGVRLRRVPRDRVRRAVKRRSMIRGAPSRLSPLVSRTRVFRSGVTSARFHEAAAGGDRAALGPDDDVADAAEDVASHRPGMPDERRTDPRGGDPERAVGEIPFPSPFFVADPARGQAVLNHSVTMRDVNGLVRNRERP